MHREWRLIATGLLAALLATGDPRALAQSGPDPIPPPLPPRPVPKGAPDYEAVVPESTVEWGLDPELLRPLAEKAELYKAFTRQFTCDEVARLATYDDAGEASTEEVRRYGYLLTASERADSFRELRQRFTSDGRLKPDAVEDEEPFPPAYSWVQLFNRFNESYFAFRLIATRFDGFDLVHEIQFRGSLPFTTGKDIRQWEGTVLVDAFKHVPLEIQAEPSHQRKRIEEIYRNYTQSFNFLGLRSKPVPLGYRAGIQFRLWREGLSFPTELRYDTVRAVSPTQVVPVRASTRSYERYRFVRVTPEQRIGDTVPDKGASPADPPPTDGRR